MIQARWSDNSQETKQALRTATAQAAAAVSTATQAVIPAGRLIARFEALVNKIFQWIGDRGWSEYSLRNAILRGRKLQETEKRMFLLNRQGIAIMRLKHKLDLDLKSESFRNTFHSMSIKILFGIHLGWQIMTIRKDYRVADFKT